MFVARWDSSGAPASPDEAIELLRPVAPPDGEFRSLRYRRGFAIWVAAPSLSPRVFSHPEGGWLAALGHFADEEALSSRAERLLGDPGETSLRDLGDLDGLYQFVHFDRRADRFSVMVDRTGVPGLYWSQDTNGIWVSSSSTAIATASGSPAAVSGQCVLFASQINYLWGDDSLFAGIEVVPVGTILEADARGVRDTTWWQPPPPASSGADETALADELARIAQEYLRGSLRGHERAYFSITGGMDSRCVCAVALSIGASPRYFTGRTEDGLEESRAAEVARALGLDWFLIDGDELTPEAMRRVLVSNFFASDGETSVLTGISQWAHQLADPSAIITYGFGGETFRDYWSHHEKVAFLLKGSDPMERALNYRCRTPVLPLRLLREDLAANARERFLDTFRQREKPLADLPTELRLDRLYLQERMRRWAAGYFRMMARAMYPVSPLFGQRTVEFAYRLPASVRRHRDILRLLLWRQAPALARLPYNGGYSALPRHQQGPATRAKDFWLEVCRFLRKVRRSKQKRGGSAPGSERRTSRAVLGPYLEHSGMVSRFLYRDEALRTYIEENLDKRLTGTMALIAAWEALLRQAKQSREIA
jgi:hypothetical protein